MIESISVHHRVIKHIFFCVVVCVSHTLHTTAALNQIDVVFKPNTFAFRFDSQRIQMIASAYYLTPTITTTLIAIARTMV